MAFNAEQLNIVVAARTEELQKEMDKAQRKIKSFEAKSRRDLKSTTASFAMLSDAAKRLGPILAAAFSIQAFQGAVDAAVEIENLSNIAGVTSDRFQILALTSRQFGIEQEKLSDILKDVNDKFGDYTQTGAGPLADFFENIAPKIGLTAAAFADMSSEQKLGAYINALEKANVTQSEMTFYMEAIASDSTALVQAFSNNGRAISEMEQKAKELGLVLDRETIEKSQEAKKELSLMASMLNTQVTQALLAISPLAIQAAGAIAAITKEIASFLSFGSRLQAMANVPLLDAAGLRELANQYQGLEGELSDYNSAMSSYNANVEKFGENSEQAASWAKRLTLAENNLQQAIAEKQAQKAAEGAAIAGIQNLASETAQLREQAEIQKMTAEDAERARIAKQRQAYEQAILNNMQSSGRELTHENTAQVLELGKRWEDAAIAASSIINPVKRAGAAAKETKETVEQMMQKIIDASPALQQLGIDADGLKSVSDRIQSSMEDAFMSIVDGTGSAKDAFKAMAADIIKELYRVLVVQRLVGQFQQGGGGIMGAIFNAFGGGVKAAAAGSTVQAGNPTITGEHGRELFVPQVNGRVMTTAQTKQMMNGGGGGVTVNQNITFGQGVSRAEINAMLPKIVETTKAAVFDAQRRSVGGRGYA
jgi:hypothetical protein